VLTLVPGRIQGAPYLESFPYFAHADGHLGNLVTCWLPATPTEWQLTTAALMAARAGQTNPTPVRWRVILGGQDTDLATTAGTVIIGTPADVAQLHLKGTALPIIPAGDSFQVAPNCNILGNTLKNKVILQAVPQAANAAGALYAIMAANDRQLVTFCRMLTNTSTMDTLTGNVCLLSPTNIATSLNAGNPVADVQVEQERNRYTLPMLTVAAVIILGLILLLFWFIRLLRGRHGKTRKRAFIPPAQS